MKTLHRILVIALLFIYIKAANAQTINWGGLHFDEKHIVAAGLGYEYGLVYELAYGHVFQTRFFPLVTGISFSTPPGDDRFDDFKVKVGGQVRWFSFSNFQFSTEAVGIFRRYENDFAMLINFGSELSGVLGYYRPGWFLAAEVGFDKAIVTHFKHTDYYTEINPTVVNGWTNSATGGNLHYGLQAGVSFRKSDLNMRIGKIVAQNFKTAPYIPYYFHLGYSRRFI